MDPAAIMGFMWALPVGAAATWWSWKTVAHHSAGISPRLVAGWVAGTSISFVSLSFATTELTEVSWVSPIWILWGIVAGVTGVLVAIDVEAHLLPRNVSIPVFLVAMIWLTSSSGPADVGRWGPIIGASTMTVVTVLFRFVSRRSLGMGDVLVSPLLGAVIGWFDPRAVLSAWLVTAVAGGIGAAFSLLRGEHRQHQVAYGPYLFLGTAVALVELGL